MKLKKICLVIIVIGAIVACGRSEVASDVVVSQEVRIGEVVIRAMDSEGGIQDIPTVRSCLSIEVSATDITDPGGHLVEARLVELRTGRTAGLNAQRIVGGATSASIMLKNSSGWQEGRHLVEVMLDGKLVASRDLDIFDLAVDRGQAGSNGSSGR